MSTKLTAQHQFAGENIQHTLSLQLTLVKNTFKNSRYFNCKISCLEGEVSMVVHAVGTDVLLDVCVLVIVDSEAHVASGPGQVGDQTGLAN